MDNKFGTFEAPKGGQLAAVKLVHLYGYVSCYAPDANTWSFWGCGLPYQEVAVAITTSKDEIILPPNEFMQFEHAEGKWAKVPGYNSVSPEIVLSVMSDPIPVEEGQELRLWYAEDLSDYYDTDNGGKVCADVYTLFMD